MTWVTDASVVVKTVVREPGSAKALELFEARPSEMAPDLIYAECGNTLWAKVRRDELDDDEAAQCLSLLLGVKLEIVPSIALVGNALRIAAEIRHPVYDCLYMALAIERASQVVTADRRFARAASALGYGQHICLLDDAAL